MLYILAVRAVDLLVGFKLLLFKVELHSLISVVVCGINKPSGNMVTSLKNLYTFQND